MASITKFRRTYQSLIISIGVIVFVVIGFLGGIYPASQKVIHLLEQKKALGEERDKLKKKLAILDSLDEQALRADLTTVIAAVPSDKSIPSLFQTVEGLASEAGVALDSISISAVGSVSTQSASGTSSLEKQIGSHLLPFISSLTGGFENIQQFITRVPSVRRLVRIRTFAMSFPKDQQPLNISFEMDAFYEPFPTSLGTQSSPIFEITPKEEQVISTLSQFPIIGQGFYSLPTDASAVVKTNPFSP